MLIDIIELNKKRFGSYEKLAERLDIDPTVICHWKAGRRKPTKTQVMQMADFIGFEPLQVLCLVMEELDNEHKDLWRKWRPYGDSNPGYRRERGLAHFHFIFVNFCNLALIVAARLNIRVNFQVLNVRNAGLFSHLNVLKVVKHDKAECLVLSKN